MKKKELIHKSHLLTPTMDRVRCGRTQLFREKNKDDRTFISEDNADVILEHENKEMYAELIDGQWYWVSGCSECNGGERGHASYIECVKHDVCSKCSILINDVEGDVWGGSNGWTCNPCFQNEKVERRRAAFEELRGEEPDTIDKKFIICPHCGDLMDAYMGSIDLYHDCPRQDIQCDTCDGEFYLNVDVSVLYSTNVKGKRITE